ncbi:MAG: hypothetical protein AB7S70_17655 [Hyphomicrobium sp.]|uniref:hypothetical protein n=1 Tax=Hyphomicrobium sp. TaxID=82 RepID=UPI003D0BE118
MRTTYLAGVGLGLVAAVAFASATTGPLFARFLLMFVTPLPIALAGLGWGWRAAALAGAAGSTLILVIVSPAVALAFLLTQALPMVLLTYLALLSRPLAEGGAARAGNDDGANAVEWYPAGRLVVWSAVIAGLMAIAMLMLMGGDLEALRRALADFIKTTLENSLPTFKPTNDSVVPQGASPPQYSDAEIAALSEIALSALPAASAMSWMASLLFNLWLAGRITLASGQLGRPWPDLAAITYPVGTPLAFGAMLFATMLTGYAGLAASAFAGGLSVAYLLLGLAILHFTTRGRPWRPFALWALYLSVPLTQFVTLIVIAMLGLAETILHLRARSVAPPASPPHHPDT